MNESMCINPDCAANQVWILDPDETCDTCGWVLINHVTAPPQKFADPDQIGADFFIHKGS